MKFDSITLKDIARELHISKSTVARAFKNSHDVSIETKSLVLEYAQKINYRPNPIATSLKKGKSHSIGVVVSEIANTYFSEAINGIESIAFDKRYSVFITQSHESTEREKVNVEQLCSHSIDGLLISLSSATSDISYLSEWNRKGLPIVFFDKLSDELDTHKVKADNFTGAFQATEHLILQGFKKIAHITALPFLSNTIERLSGYKAALEKYHIPFDEGFIKYCNHEQILPEVEQALNSLLNNNEKPDAIFTASERTTIAAFQLLSTSKQKNIIGLAGFSNNDLFNSLSREITIVHQPAFEIGKVAAELLFNLIESKRPVEKFETRSLKTNLLNTGNALLNNLGLAGQ